MRPGLVTRTTCPSCCGVTAACGVAAPETVEFGLATGPCWVCARRWLSGLAPESHVEGQTSLALPVRAWPGERRRRPARARSCGLNRSFLALARSLAFFALVGVEPAFPETNRFWRYLDQLIVLDVGQRALERQA